jgi:hypothetical protein
MERAFDKACDSNRPRARICSAFAASAPLALARSGAIRAGDLGQARSPIPEEYRARRFRCCV